MSFCKSKICSVIFSAFILTGAFNNPAAAQTASSRPIVDMVSASAVSTNKIRITWKLPKNFDAEAILIYKNTQPFTSNKMISSLTPVAQISPKALSYTDTVINYKEYFYAVIARQADGSLYNIVLPSINATVKGVRVERPAKKTEPSEEEIEASKEKTYAAGELRQLPLPYLDIIEDVNRKPNKLSDQAVKAGKELAGGLEEKPKEKLNPYFFDEDLVEPTGGDDYFLFEVLKNYFVKKDYKGSVKALQDFLSVNRSQETTDRACFYLGEAQYFCSNYRHALTMFLFVEDTYPVLSKKWINSTLDFYTIPNN